MKTLRLLLLIIILGAIGAGTGYLLNMFMGISIVPRNIMPGQPELHTEAFSDSSQVADPWVMFDPGAVGMDADTAAWYAGDYDHELRRYTGMYTETPEYVDTIIFEENRQVWLEYLDQVKSMGGTAIEFKMMLEFIDFNLLGDGFEIYAADHPMRKRHEVYRKYFGRLFMDVDSMGLDLILSTDMVVLTNELEEYLRSRPHGMNPEKKEFWTAYQKGIEELFAYFPFADGLQIRVGEAGSFYNRPNWPYRSELWVDDIDEVRTMLSAIHETCKKLDRILIFRSWTVGMGSVGDLHTDTAVYRQVFEGLDDSHLWVSTKFVQGDFYPFTPYNPTLSVGNQPRIIEFQARREYECFSSYPLWIVPYHQYALQQAIKDNPNIRGCWIWTMNGGPIRRSPMSLIPHTGDLQWIEMNAKGSAAIMYDPFLDTDSLLNAYVLEEFGQDSVVNDLLTRMLKESHEISRSGLSFPTAVRNKIRGLGTDVPAGIYTYWDLVLASTAVNAILYHSTDPALFESTLDSLNYPVKAINAYLKEFEKDSLLTDSVLDVVLEGLTYEKSLFGALAAHKKWILLHNHYLKNGGRKSRDEYVEMASEATAKAIQHVADYKKRLDFRAFNFDDALHEMSLSIDSSARGSLRWIILVTSFLMALLLLVARKNISSKWMGPVLFLVIIFAGKFDALSPSWAWWIAGASLLYSLLLSLLYRSNLKSIVHWNLAWSMLILFAMPAIIISALRGPMGFGFWFWTSPAFRIILLAIVLITLGLHLRQLKLASGSNGPWLFSTGFWMASVALAFGAFWTSLDERLTLFNDQAALLPNNIKHIYGFVQQFGLPEQLAEYFLGIAVVIIIIGALVTLSNRHRSSKRFA